MQHPTCTNIRIRSTRDAHIIFHAVSLGLLHPITRRLDADERAALQSGCVYAWEERGPHTEVTGLGIERFTEGRRWGPSRVRDEFLFYYEKSPPTHLRDKDIPSLDEIRRKHWDPLVKQTYSVWVEGPKGRRKWHLTAYFTQTTVDRLQTVDDIPDLACLDVPQGKYISTRLGKPRRPEDAAGNSTVHDVFRPANMSATRTYAPFPLPYAVTPPHNVHPDSAAAVVAAQQIQLPHPQLHAGGFVENFGHQQHGEQPRHFYGATPAHHPRYPNSPLTLPPIHALASTALPQSQGAANSNLRQSWSASQEQHPGNGENSGHSTGAGGSHIYAHYNTQSGSQQQTHQRPTYYPPTPTSSSSQNESPLYPSPASSLPPPEHTQQLQTDYPPREAYPSPYPSPPARYPSMPPAQPYPEAAQYSGYNHHQHSNVDHPGLVALPHHHHTGVPAEAHSTSQSHHHHQHHYETSFDGDRPYVSSQVPSYHVTDNIPAVASGLTAHPHPHQSESAGEARRPAITLTMPQDPRSSPTLSASGGGGGCRVRDENSVSPQLSPRSAGSNSSASSKRLLDLAPLRSLQRTHPYRRDKFDDRALSLLNSHR